MPIIYPRVSLTLVEASIQKILDRYAFDLTDYASGVEFLLKRHTAQHMPPGVNGAYERSVALVHAEMDALKAVAADIDSTLARSAEAARTKIDHVLERLQDRIVRAEKRQRGDDRDRLARAASALFPGGKPQERVMSPLYYLNRYGLDFFTRLVDAAPLDTSRHHVLTV